MVKIKLIVSKTDLLSLLKVNFKYKTYKKFIKVVCIYVACVERNFFSVGDETGYYVPHLNNVRNILKSGTLIQNHPE